LSSEETDRRRIVRTIFTCLRVGDLPTIVVSSIPTLIPWPPWLIYGWYRADKDKMRIWSGRGFSDTVWHEAAHAAQARLGLDLDEEQAVEVAAHLDERYHVPDLSLDHLCDHCNAPVYVGLEQCWTCGGELRWPCRIPRRR